MPRCDPGCTGTHVHSIFQITSMRSLGGAGQDARPQHSPGPRRRDPWAVRAGTHVHSTPQVRVDAIPGRGGPGRTSTALPRPASMRTLGGAGRDACPQHSPGPRRCDLCAGQAGTRDHSTLKCASMRSPGQLVSLRA